MRTKNLLEVRLLNRKVLEYNFELEGKVAEQTLKLTEANQNLKEEITLSENCRLEIHSPIFSLSYQGNWPLCIAGPGFPVH